MTTAFINDPPSMTKREKELIEMLAGDCLKVKAIARRLGLSVKTVETHRSNIMKKLKVHSAAQLCRFYWTEYING